MKMKIKANFWLSVIEYQYLEIVRTTSSYGCQPKLYDTIEKNTV